MRVLLLKCPKTFGQNCTNYAALVRHQYSVLVKKKNRNILERNQVLIAYFISFFD